jgi:Protein of unknown function (DUF3631)
MDKNNILEQKFQKIENEIEIETCLDNLEEITPAQSFIDDTSIVTVEFREMTEEKGKKQYVSVPYLIISNTKSGDRKRVKLTQDNLISLGYFSDRMPKIQNRWSISSLKLFLAQKNESVDVPKIFNSIKSLYKEFCDFGDDRISSLFTCWVIGTYFHRMFKAYPYIHLNGNLQTGKTKTINLTTSLAFNGETNVGSSAPYLFRSIHDNCSTVGIDEAENLGNGEDFQTLIQVLNCGYKPGTMISKLISGSNNTWKPKRFDPYSPKILGGIKKLVATLNSRSIPITMLRSNDDRIKNIDIDLKDPRFQEIRDQLYIMTMIKHQSVKKTYTEMQDTEIKGRNWELWKPMLTIAKLVGDPMYQELHTLAIEVQAQKNELIEDDTNHVAILESLLFLLDQENESGLFSYTFYSPRDIINALIDPNNPHYQTFKWIDSSKIGSRWIGDELRKLGVVKGSSTQKKVNGKNTRGYELDRAVIEKQIEVYKGQ